MPIEVYTDCKSLYDNIYSKKNVREKRLRIDIAMIKEAIEGKDIQVHWVDTSKQLANCLTKQGASSKELISVLNTGCLSKFL